MSDAAPSLHSRRPAFRPAVFLLPFAVAAIALASWHAAVHLSGSDIFPTPREVLLGLGELAQQGLLLKYVVASLFRVSWALAWRCSSVFRSAWPWDGFASPMWR